MARDIVRVGTGAGFSDDRFEPARDLAERGKVDYLVFECLAERTIARETLSRLKNPEMGYTPYLVERFEAVLPACVRNNIRVVTNMGAANPQAAARKVREVAQSLGLGDVPVAVVSGDDVAEVIRAHPELPLMESGEPVESLLQRMAAANAYLGADIIREGLATGARIVMTGRVADPSMFVGALMHGHGWSYDDYPKLAVGTLAGHLMECAAQVTGGCFIDPGRKDAADAVNIGFPYGDVTKDGQLTIGKLEDSGGRLDEQTCTEQVLYEMHDPARYITPDCVLDITDVSFASEGEHRVRVSGAKARPRTATYKAVIGYHDGYIGEGEVGYAGPNAVARARLAERIVRERLRMRGLSYPEIRVDYIGMSSLHGEGEGRPEPYEVRLRMAARSPDRKTAQALGFEMRTLHVNGPAGGGGGTNGLREVIGVKSVLLPREWVKPGVSVLGRAVKVYDLGHARAGDKGNTSNVSVTAFDEKAWNILREQLTVERVAHAYSHIAQGPVTRYELPKLRALNFVIENALGGGVTISLAQDAHGKSLSYVMLGIELNA